MEATRSEQSSATLYLIIDLVTLAPRRVTVELATLLGYRSNAGCVRALANRSPLAGYNFAQIRSRALRGLSVQGITIYNRQFQQVGSIVELQLDPTNREMLVRISALSGAKSRTYPDLASNRSTHHQKAAAKLDHPESAGSQAQWTIAGAFGETFACNMIVDQQNHRLISSSGVMRLFTSSNDLTFDDWLTCVLDEDRTMVAAFLTQDDITPGQQIFYRLADSRGDIHLVRQIIGEPTPGQHPHLVETHISAIEGKKNRHPPHQQLITLVKECGLDGVDISGQFFTVRDYDIWRQLIRHIKVALRREQCAESIHAASSTPETAKERCFQCLSQSPQDAVLLTLPGLGLSREEMQVWGNVSRWSRIFERAHDGGCHISLALSDKGHPQLTCWQINE